MVTAISFCFFFFFFFCRSAAAAELCGMAVTKHKSGILSGEMVSSLQNKAIHGALKMSCDSFVSSQCFCALQHGWLSKHTNTATKLEFSLEMVSSSQNKSYEALKMFCDSFPLTNISVCTLEFSGDGFKLTKQDPWRTGKCFCDSFPLTMSLCFAASLAVKTHNR
jgi:hypothetical protein